jgi:HEAT repeat protein
MRGDLRARLDEALLALAQEGRGPQRADAAEDLCELAGDATEAERAELAAAVARLVTDRQAEVRCAGLALSVEVLPVDEALGLLTRHVKDPEVRVRVEAVGRLADLLRPELRGVLAAALQDEAASVRFEAARGMAGLRHAAGLDVLTEALADDELRFRAAAALARLGDRAAVPHLQRVLRAWLVPAFDRTQVAGALAMLGEPEGLAHLFTRAAKAWSVDRAMAIELLGEVKAPGARERLLEILSTPRDDARGAAARALGRLGDGSVEPRLLAVLSEEALPDTLQLDLAEALLTLGGAAGRDRVRALDLSDPDARAELAALIRELAPP